jgi:hypothetical protein
MLIYVNITDRQTDGQTGRQTHQKYSSEPRDVQLLLINHEKCNHDYNYIIMIM